MAEEQKPVEVPKEETPATIAATEATPATETKAEETAAPAAGTSTSTNNTKPIQGCEID